MKKISTAIVLSLLIGVAVSYEFFAWAQTEPRLLIISPAPGEVVAGDEVFVEVRLPAGFSLADPSVPTQHVSGQGHLHLWLDAQPAHAEATSIILNSETQYRYANVFSGLHTLYAELYRNDELPYEPSIADEVNFETYREILTPPTDGGGVRVPPPGTPAGRGKTALTIGLVVFIFAILWHFFGRRKSISKRTRHGN